MTILAIDQGTTTTRAVLVDAAGAEVILSVPHRQIYPQPGWVEHDPQELLDAIAACLAAGQARGAAAVALANQGESCLAWDARTGQALSPVIVWQDDRTAADCAALRDSGREEDLRAISGLPLDPYFSASKLGWILRHVPQAAALAAAGHLRMGTTDAFFRQNLGGQCATDAATASRSGLMDLHRREWSAELCGAFGVPPAALPPIGPCAGDLGRLGPLPLRASIVDQQAALAGHGARAPGQGKITFGTGAFALILTGAMRPDPAGGALPTLAWTTPQGALYALEGGVYAASAAVNWARGLGLFDSFAEIDSFDAPPAISRGLAFVPALAGLGCPHWDRAARGAWMGLGLDTSRRDMAQALLEGIAFRAAEVLGALSAAAPLDGAVSIDGGMSRNPWFCQFLADVLARPVRVSDQAELTAVGLAALAGGAVPPASGRLVEPAPIPSDWAPAWARARSAVQDYGRR